jgi:hypothetical protein
MPLFQRYIGIEYSGAEAPGSGLPGLRVYSVTGDAEPIEIVPDSGVKFWSRQTLADWLALTLSAGPRTLVGIGHPFSFPEAYFDQYKLPKSWDAFLADFCTHWPTFRPNVFVDYVRLSTNGYKLVREGKPVWRRVIDQRAKGAKSPFWFDVIGSVAKSAHAGIPWLMIIRKKIGTAVHFWPFDGWSLPAEANIVVEVHPTLWNHIYPIHKSRTPDQQDAYCIAKRLAEMDLTSELESSFAPVLTDQEKAKASFEGWMLGVM